MSRPARKLAAEITAKASRSSLQPEAVEPGLYHGGKQKTLRLITSQKNSPHDAVGYVEASKALKSKDKLEAFASFHQFVANSSPRSDITALLVDWSNGNRAALDALLPLVEKELRRLAHSYMRRENADHTLQTTALVNEAYLRLADQKKTSWQNRAHFFGIAAHVMRRILLNHARDQQRLKRGGNARRVSLSEASIVARQKAHEIIALHEALEKLALVDKRKSQVVELRYFGGLDVEETAEVLRISTITVLRDWKFARAWLLREISND
jgi:RNA polymerase sigma-70 factor, ECF subfamily